MEKEIASLKADIKTLKDGFTRLLVYVALAAGGATLTIDKILGIFR